jgi:Protein of unknown function (DUF3179)
MHKDPSRSRRRRSLSYSVLFLLVVAAVAMVVLPIWLIRPFAPQTPDGIAIAYGLRRWAPAVTVLLLAVGLGLAVALWRGSRWWSRALAVLGVVVLAGAAWRAPKNELMFEGMFAPMAKTASVPAADARWVEDGDPVLALSINGDDAAYPVRQVSYHHIVHDVVGGVPVAVTY